MSENYRTRQERRTVKNKSTHPNKRKLGTGKIIKRILAVVFLLGLVGIIAGGITAFAFIMDTPKLDLAALEDPQSAKVYDREGNLIADLGKEKRTKVTYQEIPKIVEDAFIATEDVRFYDHFGIDLKRIGGAIIANVTEGFGAEGASTITQQVVKNAFLSPEKSIKRKVQEQWMAIQLERQFSKEQILTIYLNKIFFGNRAYGIAKAAEVYFGKELKDLEIHEAALLAGLPQRPSSYDPFKYPEAAEKRRNIVLSLMAKNGKITDEQAEKAKAIPVTDYVVKRDNETEPYDDFIDQVLEEIDQQQDIDIFTSGVSIYTTLDPKAQKFVEKVLDTNEYINYPNDRFQAGLVVLDTKTGEILAIGGGRNQSTSYFATDIKRQIGSTAKPIFDYGPAIEYLNWSTYKQIIDEPHSYTNGPAIQNWDGKYKGQMSIRDALADSRNIPALKTFQEVGPANITEFATRLGIEIDGPINEAYALGAFNGMSPLDQAGAYSAFGNNGVYTKPHTITKIVFPDGREIDMKPEPEVVMKDYTAFMITDMLKSVVQYGTGRSARVPGVQIAGKTGTTNFDDETKQKYHIPNGGVPDSWFTGYSPDYTISVWTGYSENGEDNYISGNSSGIAKQLFKLTMTELTQGEKQSDFFKPNSVVRVPVEKGSDPAMLPSDFTPEDQIVYEYFIKGTEPTEQSDTYGELPPVENVEVNYLEEENKIQLQWDYDEKRLENASFVVNSAINTSDFIPYWSGKELSLTIENPYVDTLYGFEIIVVDDANPTRISEAVTVDIETKSENGLLPNILDPVDPENPERPEEQQTEREESLPPDSNTEQDEQNRSDNDPSVDEPSGDLNVENPLAN